MNPQLQICALSSLSGRRQAYATVVERVVPDAEVLFDDQVSGIATDQSFAYNTTTTASLSGDAVGVGYLTLT